HRPSRKLQDGSELKCDPTEKTTVFIYKTSSEPQVGMLSYFKVMSGILKPGDELINSETGETERIAQLFVSEGKERIPVSQLEAGDLGVTVKLKSARTNSTLNARGISRSVRP